MVFIKASLASLRRTSRNRYQVAMVKPKAWKSCQLSDPDRAEKLPEKLWAKLRSFYEQAHKLAETEERYLMYGCSLL